MRVLWLCNIVLPELADKYGFKKQNVGGWITGAWNELKKDSNMMLAICTPIRNPQKLINGELDGRKFYSFLTISSESNTTIENQITRFKQILIDFRPDVIHIWGTEYEHSYAMTMAAKDLGIEKKIVVSIQGLLSYYASVYSIGLNEEEIKKKVGGNSIEDGINEFKRRAVYENKTLEIVKHVIGRTDWDKACVRKINSSLKYYYGGAILRLPFYEAEKKEIKDNSSHTIFMSQANYPIKGLHLVIEGFASLKKSYPDIRIRIAGGDLTKRNNAYSSYVLKKIRSLKLGDNITFLGMLNEEQMIDEYQKADVFLSSSIIENESNSICEAMILGTPVVSTFVGGVGSVVKHGESGLLYPLNEPYLMEKYISDIFDMPELARKLSKCAIKKAEDFNNRKTVVHDIIVAYKSVYQFSKV